MKNLLFASVILALTGASASASITYTADRPVGTGTLDLSITTDGTLGTLATANIVDWTIAMTDGADNFTLTGPLGGNNSQVLVQGPALTATATDLSFDFGSAGNNFILIQSPFIGNAGELFWSVQTDGSFDFLGPGEGINPHTNSSYTRSDRSGDIVIASTQTTTATPEPATLLSAALAGVAALGYKAMRRRKAA